jgi:predicted signal transduction protein with EAL and GGDEF domain
MRRPERVASFAAELAERTLHAFSRPVGVGDRVLDVGLSIGIATSRHSRSHCEELLRDADVAMYEAKEAGKRRYSVFTPAMRDRIVRRRDLKGELERAIAGRELVVRYQPIVDLATGDAVSVEALVRWSHPDRGRIPPGEFIPLAEETGLIVPLGRHVLEEACTQVHARHPRLEVQVNLSAIELEDPDLIATVAGVLERTGSPPSSWCSRSPRRCWSRTRSAAGRRCSSCVAWASSSRSTTSARATRRCPTCARCRSTR